MLKVNTGRIERACTTIVQPELIYVSTIYSSDFVTNSYGESWDSSCEKSRVPVQKQWVPKLKMLAQAFK